MTENTLSNQIQQQNGKPVNINISFNISRKQVTQNINSMDHDKSFNLKNTNIQENLTANNKPKIHTSRPLKTPQLAQTDRHIYSKDLEFPRATEQLKRKKRRKRNSVDYTNDKTANMPFFPVDLDKSLPTHKRGYTTTIMKKNQSTTKSKKQTSKNYQNIKLNDVAPVSSQVVKTDGKTMKLQKNLKTILNKLINNELSKRSLPLPSVPSKSKYNQSTALTARKMSNIKTTKKRSSKSHIISKERANSSSNINSSSSEMQIFENPKILEKLGNFKSIQNSVLVSEADQNDENEQQSNNQKNIQQKRIVIKTDQSIECIGEIHDFERNFYQQEFFQNPKKTKVNNFINKKYQQQKSPSSNTLSLIETYVKLLNSPDEQLIQSKPERRSNSKIPNNVNEKVQIYEEHDKHDRHENPMSSQDYDKLEELLYSQKNKSKDRYQQKSEKYESVRQNNKNTIADKRVKQVQIVHEKIEKVSDKKIQNNYDFAEKNSKNQSVTLMSPQKSIQPYSQNQQQDFKPFISSEMGREVHYNSNLTNTEQRQKLNELKKHQFQKWSCLLEYIKSNINSEMSTQQVLQEVYDYLSKAKVDLIKQGQSISQGQLLSSEKGKIDYNMLSGNQNKKKQKLQEQFTNRLSSQIDKSSPQIENIHIVNSNNTQSDQIQLNSYKKSKEFHSNKMKLGQLMMRSQEEQILDEETKSFKEDYQSSSVQEDGLKFMNLSTIETALKNRFNQLCHKKDKQLEQLDEVYEDKNITQQQYEQQRQSIQAMFKKETNQILMVKKNIWKGYNQAKGILDKSYITSRVQQQFGSQYGYGSLSDSKGKDRKMMKCLSQSYLGRKKIDYKKFIQQQERKKEQQIEYQTHKRVDEGQEEQESQQQKEYQQQQQQKEYQQQQEKSNNNQQQSYGDEEQNEHYYDEEQSSDKLQHTQSDQYAHSQGQQQQEQINQRSQSQKSSSLQHIQSNNVSQNKSIDEQFEKIAQQLNKLKQQHDVTIIAQQQQQKNAHLETSQEKQRQTINQINEFNIQDQKQYMDEHVTSSPVLVSASPDSSMHYEEIERSLHAYSDQQSSVTDEQQQVASSQKSDQQSSKSQQQHSQNQEQYSDDDVQKVQNKTITHSQQQQTYSDDNDQQYSDQQREILQRELKLQTSQSNKKNSLSPPLKSSLHQDFYDRDLQQPIAIKSEQTLQKIKKQQDPKVKALAKKFKYLTEEDRQDIFEFLFLDLCIELYQQPCHQNKIMDSINKHVTKQHQMSKRKKGVKTNLNVVKDYLKRFCGYMLRTNKPALDNMNVPMGPTAVEMLKYMHENQDFDDDQADESDGVVTLIIPVSIFDTFERSLLPTLEFEKYYENQQKQHERVNFLKNVLHIHNKALFDALNEFLDQQRPFGIWGKPFPWKKSSTFAHKFTDIQQQQKLKKSAQKVVEACSYVCGLLIDKQQSLVGNAKISQGYIQQIREDRISRMLANQMIQNEERWVFYDDEETEVLVEASNFVYNSILKELMQDLAKMIIS